MNLSTNKLLISYQITPSKHHNSLASAIADKAGSLWVSLAAGPVSVPRVVHAALVPWAAAALA